MAKTKNVQDFCPAATRIYNAAKKGIVNRTNSSHVKRVIDKELDKHSLSKEKIQKEISDNVAKACALTTEGMEKSFKKQVSGFQDEITDLKSGTETLIKTATKNLEDENKVLGGQVKDLVKENERLVERVNGLTEQVVNLQKPDPTGNDQKKDSADLDQGTEPDQALPKTGDEDTPPNPDQEKESSGKKKK